MPTTLEKLSKYYGQSGKYLKEHDDFLRAADMNKDLNFLIKALGLRKRDAILDIACGQGRHAEAFAARGYHVDGVDFSQYLLSRARKRGSAKARIRPMYICANVEKLTLPKKYDKAYWFFSDLAGIDIAKAIVSIHRNMAKGGKVLFDTDNIFRLLAYLQTHSQTNLTFDALSLELIDEQASLRVSYPVFGMWREWFASAGFSVERVFGNYDLSRYSVASRRLIMVVKKIA